MSYQVDSYGNAYFPAGVSVASIPATTGTQARVLVPGVNGRISSATVAQLITQSGSNLVTSVYGRTGAVTAALGDYTTDQVTEGQALYFSTSRARKSIFLTTFNTSGPATYDSSTGILNIPQYGSASNGNFVPLTRKISINGQTADLSVDRMFSVEEMVYPPIGIPLSNGTSWGASITNNSANWNTAYSWGNHAGLYSLLGHTHTFASLTSKPTTLAGYGITDAATSAQGANADTAFGWGNHALVGYLTSFTETDPTVPSHVKAITTTNISNWNTAYSWGNHALAGYLTSFTETDPIWTSEKANYALKTYVDTSISNLVDAAPTTLNTLNELAAALGDDANFSTSITTLIGTKEPAITAGTTAQYWRGDKTWQTLPIYTLSGLGGVPTSRTLTINGTSYDLSADRSWTINSMVYPSAGIAVSTGTAWGTSITDNSANWNSAFTDRFKWDGGATGLVAATGRTSLGLGTAATANTGDFAAASHTHSIANVTGLQTALDGKEPSITAGTTAQYWRGDKTWQTLPVYTLSGLGGEPAITAGTTAQYWRGDKTWQTLPVYTLAGLGGQAQLNGTGFVKASGTTISYDNSTYLTTSSASSTYLPLVGGTMTGNINWGQTDRGITWAFNTDGASIKFYNTGDGDGDSRLEFATLDNNDEYFRWGHIPSGGSFYESMRLKPVSSGNAELIVTGKIIKSGGTTSQFLKANGDIDSTAYQPLLTNPVTGTGTAGYIPKFTSGSAIGNSTIVEAEGGIYIDNYLFSGLPYFSYNTALAASFRITSNTNGNQVRLAFGTVSGVNNYSNIVTTIVDNSADTKGRLDFQVRSGNNSYATALVLAHTGAATFASTVTATSFIRSGGTSSQFLKADGSIDSSTYLTTTGASSAYLPLGGGTLSGGLNGTTASFTGNLTVSSGNATGGGIILADDGDIVDLNDAYCSMRFSAGVRIFSANRSGSPVITLSNTGAISGSSVAAGNITTGVNGSHIVQRDANGYIYANHVNFNTSETENPTISSFITSNGDGWSRKSTLAHVKNSIRSVADGTWSINITGSATDSSTDFLHSNRDFPSGTLIQTNINYAVSYGDPWVLEIRGFGYNGAPPFDIQLAGYIYYDTIINQGGYSNGTNISGLRAINYNGNLCFWFPYQGYWQGYNVKVYVPYAGRQSNRVTSISNTGQPTTAKQVDFNLVQSLHSSNYNSYSPTLTGGNASGTWGINITGNSSNITSHTINQSVGTGNTPTFAGAILGCGVSTGRGVYGPGTLNLILTSSSGGSDGVCGIDFRSGNNYPSDGASIYYENSQTGSGEVSRLVIRVENDLNDSILMRAGYHVYNARTVDNASQGADNPVFRWQYLDSNRMSLDSSGNLVCSGDITAYGSPSDSRLKTIKETVQDPIDKIMKISGYRFDWNDINTTLNVKEDVGVIAQEIAEVLPELTRTNENGYMSVRYQGLTALLIEGMKEQQIQIEELKKEIKELKNK